MTAPNEIIFCCKVRWPENSQNGTIFCSKWDNCPLKLETFRYRNLRASHHHQSQESRIFCFSSMFLKLLYKQQMEKRLWATHLISMYCKTLEHQNVPSSTVVEGFTTCKSLVIKSPTLYTRVVDCKTGSNFWFSDGLLTGKRNCPILKKIIVHIHIHKPMQLADKRAAGNLIAIQLQN